MFLDGLSDSFVEETMTFENKDDVGEFGNEADPHNGSICDRYLNAIYNVNSVLCCQYNIVQLILLANYRIYIYIYIYIYI